MKTRRKVGVQFLRSSLALLFASGAVTGCSGTAEEALTPASQALEIASNSTDAVEAANLMRGPGGLRSEAVEGFHCDSSPEVTYVEVCGRSLPATTHLEWTGCAAPRGPGMGGMDGGCQHAGTLQGTGGGGPRMGGGGMRGGGMMQGGMGTRGGTSSGTVDLTYTYSMPDGCTGAIVQSQSATFNVTRTRGDGSTLNATGTSTSTAQLDGSGPPAQKTTQLDVVRTRTGADGTTHSVHVTGSNTVAFSADVPPVRTISGSYVEASAEGNATVTLTDLVRPPRYVCPWPTSGTLTRTGADAVTHTLVYGPACGEATLDGSAVTLAGQGRGGPRR